jgi:hypothetical protein
MADENLLQRINALSSEEHALYERGSHSGLTDEDRARLREIELTLDQCWDLLRQRRAKREFGQNPDDAEVRSSGTVERYQG